MKRFIFLAKLGIVESTDESGKYQVQRIDDPKSFKEENGLDFLPPFLESDKQADLIFKSLTHEQLETLNKK